MKIDTAENTTGNMEDRQLIEQNDMPNAYKFKELEIKSRYGGQKSIDRTSYK